MKIINKIAMLMGAMLAVSACSTTFDEAIINEPAPVEVGFSLLDETTRTSLDPDGVTTRWAVGDKIAVWAKDSEGNFYFENTTFMLRYFSEEYSNAFFAANIAPMDEGEYTYLLSYPLPTSTNGTLATYTISAEQSGAYDGKYDVMLAEPVVEDALTGKTRVELNTVMRHKMHALKITIPEGRNLYGERFYRLEIEFPTAVVGDMTIDVSNPDAAPVYSNTSNKVVVESAEGFDEGDDIWVFVLPGTVDGDVSYMVRGERRKSNTSTYQLQREMRAGHVTPINMAVPTIYPLYTSVTISVDQNNLGEDFNFFDVYDSNGVHMGKFERNASNKYFIDYEGEFDADQYDNSTWRVVFDSEHAVVETAINLGDMTDYSEHTRWMNVPYLFSEDFSSLATYDGDYKAGPHTSTSDAARAGRDLAQYGISAGWTGARTGCDAAGTAILVAGRVDCVILGATRAYGRLDSPAMSALKEGAEVKVKLTFDYGGSRSGSSTYYPVGRVGYTTTPGALSAYATQFNNNEAFDSENLLGAVVVPSIPTSGSATALKQSMTYTLDACTSAHRITWHVGNMGYKSWKVDNGYSWMYVDNVKVQIVK
ncbi:MAG: fimbrillin family protein [Alistipes sp.]|nr:fimbrillin family protein [Alistipes sp.]